VRLLVFDFNPYRNQREAQNAMVPESAIRLVPDETMALPVLIEWIIGGILFFFLVGGKEGNASCTVTPIDRRRVIGGILYMAWMERSPMGFGDIMGAQDMLLHSR